MTPVVVFIDLKFTRPPKAGAGDEMNIHEYLKERGFEMTGEFRKAEPNEHYLSPDGYTNKREENHQTAGMYLILKKLRQTYEFDGQTFEVPKGYVFERIGLVRPGDLGKYLLEAPAARYPPMEITSTAFGWKCIYVILRKEN